MAGSACVRALHLGTPFTLFVARQGVLATWWIMIWFVSPGLRGSQLHMVGPFAGISFHVGGGVFWPLSGPSWRPWGGRRGPGGGGRKLGGGGGGISGEEEKAEEEEEDDEDEDEGDNAEADVYGVGLP